MTSGVDMRRRETSTPYQHQDPSAPSSGNTSAGTMESGDVAEPLMVASSDTVAAAADYDDDDWRSLLVRLQNSAAIVALVLALGAMLVVVWWVNLLGGLSWKSGEAKLVFNWHPLLMITTFCFMTVATFAFRIPVDKSVSKRVHGVVWAVAALCAMVALIAVVHSHNDKESGFIANLYSLHSWIGIFVISIFLCQFFAGLFTFGYPLTSMGVDASFKAKMLTVHYFVGPFIYVSTAATILLGIQEKEGFMGCSYKVTQADLFPIQHFFQIPLPCRVSHLLGILVLAMTLCTSFALHQFDRGSFRQS
jgi:cytochrome b-561